MLKVLKHNFCKKRNVFLSLDFVLKYNIEKYFGSFSREHLSAITFFFALSFLWQNETFLLLNRVVQTRSIKDLPLLQVLLDCSELFLLNHYFSLYYAHCLKDSNEPYLLCFSLEIKLQPLNAASAFLFTGCCWGNTNPELRQTYSENTTQKLRHVLWSV